MRQTAKTVAMDALVIGDAARRNPHDIIRISCRQMAFQNVGAGHHRLFKHIQYFLILRCQRNLDEYIRLKTESLFVQLRRISVDDPGPFQIFDPAMAGRRGQIDPICDFSNRYIGIHLQFG